MRNLLLVLCRLVLRIFFRRIEIVGKAHVPEQGPALFILNHPNGLLDPLFVLCFSGRRVSMLAKEPLFRMPLIGYFVRTFQCLPVYRKSDGADPAQNRRMIEEAVRLLQSGNTIALFPEGTSHDDPMLKPLRYGAARMALSATGAPGSEEAVRVVPVGLYYSGKTRFRSKALVTYGAPVLTPRAPLDGSLEAPLEDVQALTDQLSSALGEVTLQAESVEALRLAESAERILRACEQDDAFLQRADDPSASRPLEMRRRIRQMLVDGYAELAQAQPDRVRGLIGRVNRLEEELADRGLRVEQRVLFATGEVVVAALTSLVLLFLLGPLALVGLLINYPTYRLIGFLAQRIAKGAEDSLATIKAVGGLLFFPATWLIVMGVLLFLGEPELAVAAVLVCPLSAYAALLVAERASHAWTQSYVVWVLLVRAGLRRHVVEERRAIRDAIYELADAMAAARGRSAQ